MTRHIEEPTGPGLDHPHFPFRTTPEAPRIAWPDGSGLAFFVLLHLEAWELTPPEGAHRDPRFVAEFPAFHPDYRAWSAREYGNRVGIFRVLAALDAAGIVPAVALSAASATHHPELVAACRARGCEFLAHGTWATRMITSRMGEAEERAHIIESRDAVAQATGRTPTGWVGQDQSQSPRTPALLAGAGFDHLIDWPNDDRPYLLGPGGALVSIPAQPEWDDVGMMWLKRMPPAAWAAQALAAFHALRAEGGGAVFHLPLHPWVAGQAHRIRHVAALLRDLAAAPGAWRATPSAIAAESRAALAR